MLFLLFSMKNGNKHILTSIWSAQHPNAGQNIQQLSFIWETRGHLLIFVLLQSVINILSKMVASKTLGFLKMFCKLPKKYKCKSFVEFSPWIVFSWVWLKQVVTSVKLKGHASSRPRTHSIQFYFWHPQ